MTGQEDEQQSLDKEQTPLENEQQPTQDSHQQMQDEHLILEDPTSQDDQQTSQDDQPNDQMSSVLGTLGTMIPGVLLPNDTEFVLMICNYNVKYHILMIFFH